MNDDLVWRGVTMSAWNPNSRTRGYRGNLIFSPTQKYSVMVVLQDTHWVSTIGIIKGFSQTCPEEALDRALMHLMGDARKELQEKTEEYRVRAENLERLADLPWPSYGKAGSPR